MQKRTTILAETPSESLKDQSTQLVGYMEALFRRMMLDRKQPEDGQLEISREEIRALIILDSPGGVKMTNLAESLAVPLSTATHTVDRLVAKGLVERKRSEEDRRVVEVEMSEYGRKLQEVFRERRKAVAQSWLEPLADAERAVFLELMYKITLLAKPATEGPR